MRVSQRCTPQRGTLGTSERCPGKHDNAGAGTTAPAQHASCSSAAACSRRCSCSARSRRSAMCCTSPTPPRRSSSLHPLLSGGSSQVFAADGTRLGFIQSDERAQPGRLERDPRRSEERDGRDRGPALLPERRRRPHRHIPLGRQGHRPRGAAAGRLDDHDAARAQPVSGRRPAHAAARRSSRPSSRSTTTNTTPSARSSPATSTASPTAPSAGRPRSASRRPRASSSTSRPRS